MVSYGSTSLWRVISAILRVAVVVVVIVSDGGNKTKVTGFRYQRRRCRRVGGNVKTSDLIYVEFRWRLRRTPMYLA